MVGNVRFDPGLLRPYRDNRNRVCVTINTGKTRFDAKTGTLRPVYAKVEARELIKRGIGGPMFAQTLNATTMRKEDWIQLDTAVQRVIRQEMRAWSDLASASRVGGFDAMSKLTYEYEMMSDSAEAVVDMDVLADARTDSPLFNLASIPLPITHSDFHFSQRRIAVSANGGTPISTTQAENAAFRVAETVEKTVIGTETGITFGTQTAGYGTHVGTSTVYGYTNFPYRTTKTDLTTPTGSNPEAIMTDILEMIDLMNNDGYYGPFILYHSTPYTRFLNDDYFRSGSTSAVRTVRERLMEISDISDIRRLNYLTSGYQLILIQMDSRTAQAIDGMPVTTVQWPSMGGMRQNWKVMCIQVPLLRRDYNGNTALVHATTS